MFLCVKMLWCWLPTHAQNKPIACIYCRVIIQYVFFKKAPCAVPITAENKMHPCTPWHNCLYNLMCFLLASYWEQWKMIRQVPWSHTCVWVHLQIYPPIHVSRFLKSLKTKHISPYSLELPSQVTLRGKKITITQKTLCQFSQSITACVTCF